MNVDAANGPTDRAERVEQHQRGVHQHEFAGSGAVVGMRGDSEYIGMAKEPKMNTSTKLRSGSLPAR
jgi:hypothetical protein